MRSPLKKLIAAAASLLVVLGGSLSVTGTAQADVLTDAKTAAAEVFGPSTQGQSWY